MLLRNYWLIWLPFVAAFFVSAGCGAPYEPEAHSVPISSVIAIHARWHQLAGTWLWLGILAVGTVSLLTVFPASRSKAVDEAAKQRVVPPPRRGHYGVLALLGILLVAYGSWVPLRLGSLEMDEAWRQFLTILTASDGRPGRVDFASNMLLFVPISFCGMAALLTDRFRLWRTLLVVPAVWLVCTLASLTVEFGQLWVPSRVTSRFDVLAQLTGTALGTLLWLAVGERTTAWIRQYRADASSDHRIDWLLKTYLVGLVIYHLIPFDLTIHPADLYHKFRDGHIIVIPFANRTFDGDTLWELLFDVLVFVPVGLLCARWPVRCSASLRSMLAGTMFGAYVVAGIELGQLIVMSRFTETTDVLTGTLGVFIGVHVMARWQLAAPAVEHRSARADYFPSLTWMSLGLLYGVFLCVYFWWPLEPVQEGAAMPERLEGFFRLPFSSLERISRLNAASQIVYKVMLFVPLGVLLAKAVGALPVSAGARRGFWAAGLLAVCGFALGIEVGQSAFPPHVPDATDAALYTLGSVAGLATTARWQRGAAKVRR